MRIADNGVRQLVGFALVLIGLLPLVVMPVATAVPGDGGQLADAPTLSLTAVGSDDAFALYGLRGIQTLTIPVPDGLTPSSLNMLVELPVGVRGGNLLVTQDDRSISRTPLPTDFQAPLNVPLTGAEVVDHAVTVQLRSYLDPLDGYCLYDPIVPLRLSNASVSFAGTEVAPRVVADFLPPVLSALTLFVPSAPTRAEADAAVRMTTAVVAHYGKQPVLVRVAALEGDVIPPTPAGPFERQVVIREGPDSGVSLRGNGGVPALLIGGPAGDLANQTRLLSSDMSRLALASKAVAGPLKSVPQLTPDQTTLRALGQPGVNAVGLAPQVALGLDQTRLGRSARDVRVHLQGSYTPLPPGIGGELVASVGGQTIDHWATDASGSIDRWVGVPDGMLERYTNLIVALNISGNTGRCGEFQPFTLTIDGDSAVTSVVANPPLPQGFQSLPQAFLPRVAVGVDDHSFEDVARAVTIMAGLQRLGALPIDTAVMSVQDAVAAKDPAVLVAATGWTDQRITLPVANSAAGELKLTGTDGGEPQTVTLDPVIEYGSLQTVFDGRRTVLVATSTGKPKQLDVLLDWLNADSRRWARLSGDAALSVPDRDPFTVSASPPVAQEDLALQSGSPSLWWIAAALGAGLLVAAALLVVRLRHRSQP
ncbi:hypothetical protein [Mycobacterium sp. URHB0044]|uniref:hypothetical protein n=1 Tax=Mycobacterium sp. URHB0044 TaxID=1380386 RepID=UPI0007E8EDF1|nr:hypothetical protein [Mycobacterium sp. URHB0044]